MVEKCKLPIEKFASSWLVQLATSAKRKVISFVKNCAVTMDQFETFVKLNVLPFSSYDILIGMDWLEQHRLVFNCFDKTFTCINNDGKLISVKGIPRKTTVRQISALQLLLLQESTLGCSSRMPSNLQCFWGFLKWIKSGDLYGLPLSRHA